MEVYQVKFIKDLEFTKYPVIVENSKDTLKLIKNHLFTVLEQEKGFVYNKSLSCDCNYTVKLYQERIEKLTEYQTLINNCRSTVQINTLNCVSLILFEVIQSKDKEFYK